MQGVSAALFALSAEVCFGPSLFGVRWLKSQKSGLALAAQKVLTRVCCCSVAPGDDRPGFEGSWSNYPYFPSGIVVATSMERGLFVLDPAEAKKQQ